MHQHLLRVTRSVVEFTRLVAAVLHAGGRAGWLELPVTAEENTAEENREAPGPLPESLAIAADSGVLRAVSICGGRSVAVKPMRGAPVLQDVLREHFRGCQLVLVTGEIEAPLLEPEGEDWMLTIGTGSADRWTTKALTDALRRPRPWGRDRVQN